MKITFEYQIKVFSTIDVIRNAHEFSQIAFPVADRTGFREIQLKIASWQTCFHTMFDNMEIDVDYRQIFHVDTCENFSNAACKCRELIDGSGIANV